MDHVLMQQLDDELAIQKQINIKKMSEDFGSEAERKSQLSLDEQMQGRNQGREEGHKTGIRGQLR